MSLCRKVWTSLSRRLQLPTFGDLSQWVPGASAMYRRHTQICSKCKCIAQLSSILPLNMDRLVLLEYVATAYDVHLNYFRLRQPLACLRMPQRCPGIWEPGFSTGGGVLIYKKCYSKANDNIAWNVSRLPPSAFARGRLRAGDDWHFRLMTTVINIFFCG